MPTLAASVWIFGWRSLLVTAVCAGSCVFFEWGYEKLNKIPVTVGDLSAVVTGVLLAFNLPVAIPLWQAVFGCLVAIVAVKMLFGGIGKNFANPAITARIVLLLAFSTSMCAIGQDGKILKCQTLDVSGETKTLGGQTASAAYTDRYTGQDASLSGVDAISGATITSTAYKTCVQDAFAAYDIVKGAN